MADGGRGNVVPMVPRIVEGTARPQGEPLSSLWRLFWQVRGASLGSYQSKKNYRRCEALARSLPEYPGPGDVVVWLANLSAVGLGPSTVAMHRDILHGVYTVAQRAGWATSHPVALAPWRRPPPPRLDPCRNMADLWPAILRTATTPRQGAFLGVLRFLGVRLEEALGLEPHHVVRRAEPWRVEVVQQRTHPNRWTVAPPKGRKGKGARRLPVPPPLAGLLGPVLAEPPVQLLFAARGMPRERRAVPFLFPFRQHDLGQLRDRLAAVAPDVFGHGRAWHAFRRARAWELRAAGKPIRMISDALGHESEKTTETYFGRLSGADVDAGVFDGA